jgi:hypothetical protein
MRSTNSRKGQTSITHLMNFTLPPRPQNHHLYNRHIGSGRQARRAPTWGPGSGYHAVDKARQVRLCEAKVRLLISTQTDTSMPIIDL